MVYGFYWGSHIILLQIYIFFWRENAGLHKDVARCCSALRQSLHNDKCSFEYIEYLTQISRNTFVFFSHLTEYGGEGEGAHCTLAIRDFFYSSPKTPERPQLAFQEEVTYSTLHSTFHSLILDLILPDAFL